MEKDSNVARVETTIDASVEMVWHALTTPSIVKKYMFGADVISDFEQGSDIRWVGDWKGTRYEDRGKIVSAEENRRLQYSHFSPLSGKPDAPENYHLVTISLMERDGMTGISLEQDNNETAEAKAHAEKNWKAMLQSLKDLMEAKAPSSD